MLALFFNMMKGAWLSAKAKLPPPSEGWDLLTWLYQLSRHTLVSFICLNTQVTIEGDCFSLPELGFVVFFKHFNDMQIATIISEMNVTAFSLYIVTLPSTSVLLLPLH